MKIVILRGTNLNTEVYRGYAPIADLAKVSASDPFNQDRLCDSNRAKMVVKQSERRWVDALSRLTSPLTA